MDNIDGTCSVSMEGVMCNSCENVVCANGEDDYVFDCSNIAGGAFYAGCDRLLLLIKALGTYTDTDERSEKKRNAFLYCYRLRLMQVMLNAGDAQDPGRAVIEEMNQAITNQDATPMVEEAPALNQAIANQDATPMIEEAPAF
jgi:hypothetical protein